MLDFVNICTMNGKNNSIILYPEFMIMQKTDDIMIRGKSFYAIWDESQNLWVRNERHVQKLVDLELQNKRNELPQEMSVDVKYLKKFSTKKWTEWQQYVKSLPDDYHELDANLTFSNTAVKKKDYVSKRLNYPLESCDISAYEELMSTIYDEDERDKLEWAIGAIICGDSKKLQKFIVLYGEAGSGKSTFLNIVQQLFDGYWISFNAKELASANNSFAMEQFRDDPLVAIQHDGDLSRIEDNTLLNSIVSHETVSVNEKFKSKYQAKFKSFLFLGTNRPVKITEAKSGLLRRLIDVSPSGRKVDPDRYNELMQQITFELGGIACHCLNRYRELGKHYYDRYKPVSMIGATNDFYNFVMDSYDIFVSSEYVTLDSAWRLYKEYCEEAKIEHPFTRRVFKNELMNYFESFTERERYDDGNRQRSVYRNFLKEKFDAPKKVTKKKTKTKSWLTFEDEKSIFDEELKDCPAQLATVKETPKDKWCNVTTILSDIDTSQVHYVKVPESHIVIDFDLCDDTGTKSFERNYEAACKFPPTYAELSKSGKGIHLHYIYTGDVTKLGRVYDDNVEVKVFTGGSALRRRLTKCCNRNIATLNSGLPLKGEAKVVNKDIIKNERVLRAVIKKALRKQVHPNTKSNIDFIEHVLNEAYLQGYTYDVRNMRPDILAFAAGSTHQSEYCIKMINRMHFSSDDATEENEYIIDHNESIKASDIGMDKDIAFFDVEVFPNLFVIVWKLTDKKAITWINPDPVMVEDLATHYRLVGFNNRKYDNHIIYARAMGYTNEQLYTLSQRIISDSKNCTFLEAYRWSYADVYDFSSKKQSLKKFEIELGIHHQELGLPWDKPVPEDMWQKVADYCINDVVATEAVFYARQEDFVARQILAELSGLTVNDTTRMHCTKIMFGNNKNPQNQFNYRNLAEPVGSENYAMLCEKYDRTEFRVFNELGEPTYQTYIPGMNLPHGYSLLPFFPGYKKEFGKSTYRGEEVGEGGYVYAEHGMYWDIGLYDIASMHPTSIEQENLFGPYTKMFKEIKASRIFIKHKDFDSARKLIGGMLNKFLDDVDKASDLAQALKIVINSIYGFTAATFDNPFKDPRNHDNIVAKRGALFMVNLKHEVAKRGYTVAHIKTDSIKIPNATEEIKQFVMDYGKEFGYIFEHEATYDRMCLVNNAVYIAKYSVDSDINGSHSGEWTATGTQFQIPYVFKTLFSHEPILFEDMCETKTVTTAIYLDMNERLPEGEHDYYFVGKAGLFCPIKPGCGGGELMREKDGKYSSVTGTKDFRWMESEMVENLHKEDDIDKSYYRKLVDEAVASISAYGDFESFAN